MTKPIHALSPSEAALVSDVLSAIRRFRRLDAKLSLEEMYVLLAVAARPGITQLEMANDLELKPGAMSRVCTAVADYKTGNGLGLLTQTIDPNDRRSRPMFPLPGAIEVVRDALRDLT